MKRYTFVLLSVFVCFTTIYAQSKSAIEFYDTTGSEPASRIGWTGDKDNGHFFVETPGEDGEIKVQKGNLEVNGTVKAAKFEGDGSGLTNLPCSSNGVSEINITDAAVNEDGELVFELSDGETIEAGVVKGADGAAGINWRGTWDSEKTFKKRDAVFYEGSSYYAADDDPAGVPGTDNSWSVLAKKGDKGEPGSGGAGSGVSVTGASINEDGKLVLELSDSSQITAGVVKGTDGKDGSDGTSIDTASIDKDGKLILKLSDGSNINAGVVKGADGADGKDGSDGEDGKDGISIENASINTKGELVIKLDDGESINVGVVKGIDGADGEDGTSVSSASIDNNGKLILKLSNNTEINAGNVRDSILTDSSLVLKSDNAKIEVRTDGNYYKYSSITPEQVSIGSHVPSATNSTDIQAGKASFSNPSGGSTDIDLNTVSLSSLGGYKIILDPNDGIQIIHGPLDDTTSINGNSIETGTVRASDVIVNGSSLRVPDYVFEDSYNLKSLSEVKSFIKEHRHLPDVQNAKDIAGKGMDIVKMNLDLLRKVEELTLYILEQNEEVNKLKSEMEYLKQKLNN